MSLKNPLKPGELRVLITGARNFSNRELIRKTLNNILEFFVKENPEKSPSSITLISGNCPRGADLMCEEIAEKLGFAVERYPAQWETHGKAAGLIRNQEMVDSSFDVLIAFPTDEAKGTWDCVRRGKKSPWGGDILIRK